MDRPVLDQNLYYLGMKYTSATFTSATVNVLPALTFIMAIIFRYIYIDYNNYMYDGKFIASERFFLMILKVKILSFLINR